MTIMATRICSIEVCGEPAFARGWCQGHYKRWHRRGDPKASPRTRRVKTTEGEPLRYLNSVLDGPWSEECVAWPFGQSSDGYARIRKDGRMQEAHVIACERRHGPRPDGRQAGHVCNVRNCINPRHLYWATPKENQGDRVAAGTHNRGERSGTSKLTESKVREIRWLAAEGLSNRELSERFGVATSTIWSVVKRVSWAWIA